MDLVQAFRMLAPRRPGDVRGNRRLDRAVRVVRTELVPIARGVADTPEQQEDLADETVRKIAQGGPRNAEVDPDTERRVRAYLRTAVRNNWRSVLRRLRRERETRSDIDPAEAKPALVADYAGYTFEEIQGAWSRLANEVVPALLSTGRGGERTAVSLDEMIRLRLGAVEQEDLLDVGRVPPDAFKRARDASQQRHKNARLRLLEAIDRLYDRGALAGEDADLLRTAIRMLKRRRTDGDGHRVR